MKNKKRILRVIVLSVVIGFLAMSCKEVDPEYTWTFSNASSYTVDIFSANFSPSAFTLAAGATLSFTNSNTSVTFLYTPADKVDASSGSNTTGGWFTFVNR
jgi:plastocyanin